MVCLEQGSLSNLPMYCVHILGANWCLVFGVLGWTGYGYGIGLGVGESVGTDFYYQLQNGSNDSI